MAKSQKRTVAWNGQTYSVRSSKIEIPDLSSMERFDALLWLNANTHPRGHSRSVNLLAGFGGAIEVR